LGCARVSGTAAVAEGGSGRIYRQKNKQDKEEMAEESDFDSIVGRLDIDERPRPSHRDRLRWEVLSTFNEIRRRTVPRWTVPEAVRRIMMRGLFLKIAVTAVIVIGAAAGIKQLGGRTTVEKTANVPTPMPSPTPGRTEDSNMIKLDFDLPKPMFEGTKHNIRVPHLEKLSDKPRKAFLAPAGTRNVALGKPVSSSDEEPVIGEMEMITDGDKEAADGSYVELGPLLQHVTVDLEGEHEIYAVLVWHYHKQKTVYFDVVVQVAEDADFTQNVRTVFNNDIDNSSGLGAGKDMHYIETHKGKLIDAKGVRGRYVRLYSRGNTANDLNHYIEVAVYGKPVTGPAALAPIEIKLPRRMFVGTPQDRRVENLRAPLGRARPALLAPVGTTNVALGKAVSSSDEEPVIGEIEMITDGDKEATDGSYVELGPSLQHVTIDLGGIHEIYAVVLWHYHKQARVYFDVAVQVADDADFVANVRTLFNNDVDNSAGLGVGKDMHYTETNEGELIDAKGARTRYVRLYSRGNTSDELNHYIEVEVYGRPVK
jgi:hypothetical protein